MTNIFLAVVNFIFLFFPVSVGNHTTHGGGGGSTHGSGGSSGLIDSMGIIGAAILMLIIILSFVIVRKKGGNGNNSSINYFGKENPQKTEAIVNTIKQHDINFSRDNFLSWAEKVFVQLQEAWEERDFKKARPFESESLFNTHKAQLDDYIKNGTINIMDNVCVNKSFISDYYMDADKEYLTVFMETRYHDYIIREDTREVVEGNPKTTYLVKYTAKFVRTVGVQTGNFSNKSTTICPNCGAPVDVNAAGQCAYCGTVITDTTHDWVLCDLDDCGQSEI